MSRDRPLWKVFTCKFCQQGILSYTDEDMMSKGAVSILTELKERTETHLKTCKFFKK